MIPRDKIISTFVVLAFISTIPTWFSAFYETDEQAWFVYDICSLVRISLLPLMAMILVKSKVLKTAFGFYYGLTLFNILNYVFVAEGKIGINYIVYLILASGTIAGFVLAKLLKSGELYGGIN